MQKRKICTVVLSWILVLLCMAAIFYFSAQPAVQSDETSEGVLAWLTEYLHISATNWIVRKMAHLSEYFALSVFTFHALMQTFGKPKVLLNLGIPLLYAVSDEIHQYFVDGRACRIADVGIDMLGAGAGFFFLLSIWSIFFRQKKHNMKKINKKCI